MRLAISNIAWDTSEDAGVARLLQKYSIDAIDVAPGKYFPEPDTATVEDIGLVKQWWAARGVEIAGMQALLFGSTGLNLFGTPGVQERMLARLAAVCRIGAGLGARRLVFGSPKNRDRSGLSDAEATEIAVPFFRRLGDIAGVHGVMICLEPNPPCYGANFMTTSAETARVVERVAHPAIRMQLDTGALTINGESPATVLRDSAGLIGHIHASEPNLVPLGDGLTDHAKVFEALTPRFRDYVVTIEMLATKDEPHLVSIERALGVAIHYYRDSDHRQTA
jgi:D-psicose/D-tagatose/L-ribulose 3-epimerase